MPFATSATSRTIRLQGVLLALTPLPLALLDPQAYTHLASGTWTSSWPVLFAVLGTLNLLWAAGWAPRPDPWSRLPIWAAMVLTCVGSFEVLVFSPRNALLTFVTLAWIVDGLLRGGSWYRSGGNYARQSTLQRHAQRTRCVAATALGLMCSAWLLGSSTTGGWLIGLSGSMAVVTSWIWCLAAREPRMRLPRRSLLLLQAALLLGVLVFRTQAIWLLAHVGACAAILALVPSPVTRRRMTSGWSEPLLLHPARLLVSTFLGLCLLGTLLLLSPGVMVDGEAMRLEDAAFTAVSAVCVTGLIVRDTATEFTGYGQCVLLMLIQIGGLGIMSISSVTLQALGRRLSLRQERVLAEASGNQDEDLVRALSRILLFTLACEAIGALLLWPQFAWAGDSWGQAIWRALFTSVSAFCNAGFALQTDSLVGYQQFPGILHTISYLIILGGLAPATVLAIPARLQGRPMPVASRLTLTTTGLLLIGGWLAYVLLEWEASLSDLAPFQKLNNAWFQAVTFRTAGFNSVDLARMSVPMFTLSLGLMFIGGSPGGTAGGAKTTTLALVALAAWTVIRGRQSIILFRRRIEPLTVFKAIAVLGSGGLSWLVVLLALEITQDIPARQVVFETTSAVATVGLSIGATADLDGIGKCVIMVAMFLGRVGPLTAFSLLSRPTKDRHIWWPEARIPIS